MTANIDLHPKRYDDLRDKVEVLLSAEIYSARLVPGQGFRGTLPLSLDIVSISMWETIDSAPDGGEMIWVFGGVDYLDAPFGVRTRIPDGSYWRWEAAHDHLKSIPTHWMPIVTPDPPATDK